MEAGFVEISKRFLPVFSLSFDSFSFLTSCSLNTATSSTLTKYGFIALEFYRDEISSLCGYVPGEKNVTINVRSRSFYSTIPVHAEDEQRFSKANGIHQFGTGQSNERTCSTCDLKIFLFLRLKRCI